MSPEEIRNQCEDDADRAPSDLTVWRDRGAIIAQQQARITQLEAQIAAVLRECDDVPNAQTPLWPSMIRLAIDEAS